VLEIIPEPVFEEIVEVPLPVEEIVTVPGRG
jgi:hypothetical protein